MQIKDLFRNIEYPIRLYDENNNEIYRENSGGYWNKKLYDKNNNKIYFEDSTGVWVKREYDENNNKIYYEDSNGYWGKSEYDENSNILYYEDSTGFIIDKRPKETKELTVKEISDLLGYDIKVVK